MEQSNDQRLLSDWQEYLESLLHAVEVAREAVAYYTAKLAIPSYNEVMENPGIL